MFSKKIFPAEYINTIGTKNFWKNVINTNYTKINSLFGFLSKSLDININVSELFVRTVCTYNIIFPLKGL